MTGSHQGRAAAVTILLLCTLCAAPAAAEPARSVTLGIRGHASFPITSGRRGALPGGGLDVPISFNFPNAWGLRLAVMSSAHRERDNLMGWWRPDRRDEDGDGVWEPDESAGAEPEAGRMRELRGTRTLVFGLVLALHRDFATRKPWLRPYAGGGLVFGSVFQIHELDPRKEGYLLEPEARRDGGSRPASLQLVPGMAVHGGLSFRLQPGLTLAAEASAAFLPLPTAGIENTRPEFVVLREPYDLFLLRIGVGLDVRI